MLEPPFERVLLLQGPMGPFFRRFGEELRSAGVRVFKVNFHAGDALFYPGPDAIPFRGAPDEWPTFFDRVVEEKHVEAVFLFGDMRPIHRAVIDRARAAGVRVFVFEEGYLRPDFVTLEEDGVNGHSRMPTDPAVFRRALDELESEPPAEVVGPPFSRMAWYATFYALAMTHLTSGYPGYVHHRPLNAWWHTYIWCKSVWIKVRRRWKERHVLPRLVGELSKRYYFLPLQVHSDAQVQHSPFPSVDAFVEHAVAEFARHADPSVHLVVKHHPLDRPFRDYTAFLEDLAAKHGLGDRIVYVDDLDLQAILDHALGTITMNSTVGLTSLERGTPVKVLGRAIYDIEGLTFGGTLEEFLRRPGKVDLALLHGFRRWLRHHNQANGNFARRLRSVPSGSGVRWPAGLFAPSADRARERARAFDQTPELSKI